MVSVKYAEHYTINLSEISVWMTVTPLTFWQSPEPRMPNMGSIA